MLNTSLRIRGAVASVCAICLVALSACGKSPSRVGENYLDSLKLRNYPAVYQMLSHQDQVDQTLEQFLTDIPMAPDVTKDWFRVVLLQTNYQVGEAKTEGADKAVVPVKVTAPDLALWERTINAKLTPIQSPESAAQKSLDTGDYPKVTYDDSMVMVKEGGEWRLFVDFAARDMIKKQHKEAVELYHKHDFDKAIAAYQDLIAALDKEEATDNQGLRFFYARELTEIQAAKAQIPDAQAYASKLVLSDVDMKMAMSRVPGIFGKITNSGDKAIDEVQMTVTYSEGKGKKKKLVYTEEHTPISTPLEFTNFSRAVLPLVPGETRSFGFRLSAPPDIQQKATPDLNVSAIAFTQSQAPLPTPPPASPAASPTAPGKGTPAGASPAGAGGAPPPPLPK